MLKAHILLLILDTGVFSQSGAPYGLVPNISPPDFRNIPSTTLCSEIELQGRSLVEMREQGADEVLAEIC